jgi:hypothetical protein
MGRLILASLLPLCTERRGRCRHVISVLESHSRAILASGISRSQDLPSYLCVLYSAVERYGSPEAIVTDGGARFSAGSPEWSQALQQVLFTYTEVI